MGMLDLALVEQPHTSVPVENFGELEAILGCPATEALIVDVNLDRAPCLRRESQTRKDSSKL